LAQAMPALVEGKIDAAFLVASSETALIKKLLLEPGIELVSFDRAAAYTHLFPFLTAVTLSEGMLDLEHDIPSHDTKLIAVAASLITRDDLNDNLVPLLLKAVTEVHQGGGALEQRRQFPSVDFADIPLNEDAQRYILNGPTFLYRWFPYGTAVLLDRLKILILPLLALIPLLRIAPPLYNWRIRRRIYRWYAIVRDIDAATQPGMNIQEAEASIKRLKELEKEVASVSVPLSYTGELYQLRLHIGFLQEKVASLIKGS